MHTYLSEDVEVIGRLVVVVGFTSLHRQQLMPLAFGEERTRGNMFFRYSLFVTPLKIAGHGQKLRDDGRRPR